jgi:cbb3-type cytochrome oxidase maturation protein
MSVIFLLIILSLIIALGFLGAFFWAVRSGQYDDDYTPAVRILLDDEEPQTDSEA